MLFASSVFIRTYFTSINPSIWSTSPSSSLSAMAGPIIQPCWSKLEKGLDLNPILGELVSNKLISENKMKELDDIKNSTKQNRAFLMYLHIQPVRQLKRFCHILQGDIGNAFHQEVAEEILVAISADPWKRVSNLLLTIVNQFSQNPDTCAVSYPALKQTMDQYQQNFPQQPCRFLADLLHAMELIAGVTDVTLARGEILRVYQSLDW